MTKIILDHSALMAFLTNSDGADEVERALQQAVAKQQPVYVSTVSWGELHVQLAQIKGPEAASRTLLELEQLGLNVEVVDERLSTSAAATAIRYSLPYNSCLDVALAAIKKGTLLTTDVSLARLPGVVRIPERKG